MTPQQPDDPWDRDEMALGRLFRQIMVRGGYGNVEQQADRPSSWSTWTLGLFGASIVIMLGFVLNAVYTTNGDLHELKGQNQTLQAELTSMRTEMNSLSLEMGALNARKP